MFTFRLNKSEMSVFGDSLLYFDLDRDFLESELDFLLELVLRLYFAAFFSVF